MRTHAQVMFELLYIRGLRLDQSQNTSSPSGIAHLRSALRGAPRCSESCGRSGAAASLGYRVARWRRVRHVMYAASWCLPPMRSCPSIAQFSMWARSTRRVGILQNGPRSRSGIREHDVGSPMEGAELGRRVGGGLEPSAAVLRGPIR